MSVDVVLGDSLGSTSQPRLDDHFFEVRDGDRLEADQDRRIPVEVRGREEDSWISGDKRLLCPQVLYSRTKNRTGRCVVPEGADVRGPKRPLPHE